MRKLLCVAILYSFAIAATHLCSTGHSPIAFNHPASATDLNNFYRSIRALSADSFIDGTAVAMA
ncbi:MAG TPA: hypothetical protein VJ281_07700 [Chthoniobacterales bacterium]|jgi:hypothetical protein|nr:hypothetical protein [Chthoniobacterales bacterium]